MSAPADPRLAALIREEIEASGPVTFARFMERALYEPALGYYATSVERTAPQGDFVTAPELHPIFGWTLGRQLDEMWRLMGQPADFVLREYGAGSGALVTALLDGLTRIDSGLTGALAYEPMDLPRQRAAVEQRLGAAGHGERLRRGGGGFVGAVVANEFLDALPVHRVAQRQAGLRELLVDWRDGQFVEVEADPTSERLADWFGAAGVTLADGQQAEVNLGIADWLLEVGHDLKRGYVLVVDYGADPAQLYGPSRMTGTLRAFAGQRVSSDVLGGVGERDITAHVDFGALERAARAAGLDVLGRRKLNEFLIAAGLDDAYQAARADADADWDSALLLRASVRRLLDTQALGGYLVAILGKGVTGLAPLTGLSPLPLPARDAR